MAIVWAPEAMSIGAISLAPVEKLTLGLKQTVIDGLLDQSMAKAICDIAMSTHAGQEPGLAKRFGRMHERFPARVRQQRAKQRNGETITHNGSGTGNVSGRTQVFEPQIQYSFEGGNMAAGCVWGHAHRVPRRYFRGPLTYFLDEKRHAAGYALGYFEQLR